MTQTVHVTELRELRFGSHPEYLKVRGADYQQSLCDEFRPVSHVQYVLQICVSALIFCLTVRLRELYILESTSHILMRESTDDLSGQKISTMNNFQAHAKSIIVGASEQISALCYSQDGTMLFSASSNGEIIRWDSMDGACTHQVILEGTHSGLKYLGNPQTHHLLLVFGNYSKAYLLDASTLDLAIILNSDEQPNWISAMLPIPLSLYQKETHILGITAEPLIKIWDVPRLDIQFPESDCKAEDKSRHTDLKNVLHVTHWPDWIYHLLTDVGLLGKKS